jgi:hypothetical protein
MKAPMRKKAHNRGQREIVTRSHTHVMWCGSRNLRDALIKRK